MLSFVRQPRRSLSAAGQRRLMLLRVGVDAQPLDADAAPGVIWQDIGSNALDQLVLGYTMAIGADAAIGNQARLHAARGSCDGSGCSFIHPRQHDGSDRDIRAESARVVLLEAATEDPWAEPNGLLRLRVLIENRGPQLQGPVVLGASWGGPWDIGVAQQHFDPPPFGDSASQLLDLEVQVPAELSGR